MLLILDLETSGLLNDALPIDSPQQPWIVSIACELTSMDGTPLASFYTGIRANGRTISEGARRIHGVSSAQAGRSGISELAALAVLCGKESFASQARYVIGHGVSFDRKVIEATLARHGREAAVWARPGLQFIDTMTAVTPFCHILPDPPRSDGSYKWASLEQACSMLLGEPAREGFHAALDDLHRVKRLFFWLRERKAFDIPEAA